LILTQPSGDWVRGQTIELSAKSESEPEAVKNQDRRKRKRLALKCTATLHAQLGSGRSIDAVAQDLSPSGAFIKTGNWRSLQVNDRTLLTLFLPPDFTGQQGTITLQGSAVISRIDQENEVIGVQFVESLKQFEIVTAPEVPGKLRYKKLAYYLASTADTPLIQFRETHPNGFLIERSERFFDKSVIFQFITDVTEDQVVLDQLRKGTVEKEVLEARVIEIEKRKSLAQPDIVTIGRSPDCDIVLYNRMVSRSHAYLCLSASGETCHLVDTGSTNGTFLNDEKVTPKEKYRLTDGNEICFGGETRVLYFSGSAFYKFLESLQVQ